MKSLLEFPNEILLKIIENFDDKTLESAYLTNKQLRSLIIHLEEDRIKKGLPLTGGLISFKLLNKYINDCIQNKIVPEINFLWFDNIKSLTHPYNYSDLLFNCFNYLLTLEKEVKKNAQTINCHFSYDIGNEVVMFTQQDIGSESKKKLKDIKVSLYRIKLLLAVNSMEDDKIFNIIRNIGYYEHIKPLVLNIDEIKEDEHYKNSILFHLRLFYSAKQALDEKDYVKFESLLDKGLIIRNSEYSYAIPENFNKNLKLFKEFGQLYSMFSNYQGKYPTFFKPENALLLSYSISAAFIEKNRKFLIEFINKCLEFGVNLECAYFSNKVSPLYHAISSEDVEIVKFLHEKGATLTPIINNDGNLNKLHKANPIYFIFKNCSNELRTDKSIELIKFFIEKGVDIEEKFTFFIHDSTYLISGVNLISYANILIKQFQGIELTKELLNELSKESKFVIQQSSLVECLNYESLANSNAVAPFKKSNTIKLLEEIVKILRTQHIKLAIKYYKEDKIEKAKENLSIAVISSKDYEKFQDMLKGNNLSKLQKEELKRMAKPKVKEIS